MVVYESRNVAVKNGVDLDICFHPPHDPFIYDPFDEDASALAWESVGNTLCGDFERTQHRRDDPKWPRGSAPDPHFPPGALPGHFPPSLDVEIQYRFREEVRPPVPNHPSDPIWFLSVYGF